jgi:hypothetical protein
MSVAKLRALASAVVDESEVLLDESSVLPFEESLTSPFDESVVALDASARPASSSLPVWTPASSPVEASEPGEALEPELLHAYAARETARVTGSESAMGSFMGGLLG